MVKVRFDIPIANDWETDNLTGDYAAMCKALAAFIVRMEDAGFVKLRQKDHVNFGLQPRRWTSGLFPRHRIYMVFDRKKPEIAS